ncbi:MAG: two-component regulator propeller domain-containing protein [Bacteroidota bacterium]
MWFGTPDGLCRYDGNELNSYKYNATRAGDVINNFVRGLVLEDKEGNIWYSNESGIYKWDVYKEQVMKVRPFKKDEFGNVDFRATYIDTTGSLWLFNVIYGMFEFDVATGSLKRYPLPVATNTLTFKIATSAVDETGNIWLRIVSHNEPYFVFNTTTHSYSIQLAQNPPHAVFFTNYKMIQAFDDRLIYDDIKTGETDTVSKLINHKNISFYSLDGIKDNYGRLWMTAQGNGLFYYDEKYNRFQEYHHDNSKLKSLPFDLTTCLFIDRSQNLWIGMDGGGVARLDLKQPKFNLFPLSEGDYPILKDYFTKCFYEDEKGRTWFGTHTNGLNILDHESSTLVNYQHKKNDPTSIPGNIISAILKDRDGNIWVGGSGGFSIFNESKGTFHTIELNGLPLLFPERNIFVYKMIQLKNGDLLAATLIGLVRITKQKNGSYEGAHFNDDPRTRGATTDVVELPSGTIYCTITNVGFHEMTPRVNEYQTANIFLAGLDLRSVQMDEENTEWLWVATGIGLIHFNTKTKKHTVWNEKNGLANSYVYGMLDDGKKGFWLSTNGGLSYYNKQAGKFENYTYQDGLQSNEFNTQAFYKSPKGTFYFGGIKGFNWFKTGGVNIDHIKPAVAITKIEIGDAVFEKDSGFVSYRTITVTHDHNDFNFQFAALDYTRPEANKMQYMLENWDGNWITTAAKSVRYSNLLPGHYTFRVKACNAEGVWSNEESIFLIIKAPFWQQLWFRVTSILLLLSLIILITYVISQAKAKRKLQLLEKQIAVDNERNRISADMHDEIGNGITHIALLSELIQTREKNVDDIKKDVSTIALSARKLVQTMSEIIWALSPQNDTLESLLAYIREQSQQYFDGMEIAFVIDFPQVVPDIILSNEKRRNLFLVSKEALYNALKHSGSKNIFLSVTITPTQYCFCVSDNGIGMSAVTLKTGSNGLKNMKKRMQIIGGTIEWKMEMGGTTVVYCLPQ